MKQYSFCIRTDKTNEPISKTYAFSRLVAAQKFASIKKLQLKMFLTLYKVSR
jgi:hypothetical protein